SRSRSSRATTRTTTAGRCGGRTPSPSSSSRSVSPKRPPTCWNGASARDWARPTPRRCTRPTSRALAGAATPRKRWSEILARDFGSLDRWRAEFRAMGYALGGGSGWVLLTYVPRDGRLMNQYAAEHSQAVASGVPILALDMYEHAYHMDFGANAKAYVVT